MGRSESFSEDDSEVPQRRKNATKKERNEGKSGGIGEKKDKGKRAKKKQETYALYIYKVLKQVHPEVGVSRKAMNILNSFVNDFYDRITKEASSLVRWQNKRTISSREIQTSVKLNLPGDLARHAISEGNRAIAKYVNLQ